LLTQINLAQWREALEVNLLGTVYACHYVLPSMIGRRNGSIINFSGGGATSPRPLFSAYGVSKAAVVRLTETIAAEVAQYGVRVNAIAPGAVDTRLQDAVLAAGNQAGETYARIRTLRESGKGWTPATLPAELAVFLASDEAVLLTGRLISAPHDSWREWTPDRLATLAKTPWYTLRRIDPFTVASIGDSAP
jgi:NAD(P)-dependent dehydrogenase (short-subunit alcohol dehydrogenase family)